MAGKRGETVPRPLRKGEYRLVFGTREAAAGWRDLAATQRSALVDAWEYLTVRPHDRSPRNHPLKGDLGAVVVAGRAHEQWQHELSGGARIWFFVDGEDVTLVQVHTRHPNQTK